ncbi:helix-turn-helix domain-containing protein [Clostridium tyrobutyricum]|uniref:helix-turn-helix domain-containing protein n=1 Tax=Clostridium tyrobutyricum TaxID=1519 RepID=UPI00073D6F07|nr:AraC family transcriptional regulator [Clostridium tyrobutyricum]
MHFHINIYTSRQIGFEIAIKSYLYKLIVILLRNYIEEILTEKQFNLRINTLNRFKDVLSYIHNNFNKKITLDELSKITHFSKEHFCRKFKQITGSSTIEYINNLRIQRATLLLEKTDLNITEIALACGFEDINYFSRIYKKSKNMSPVNFRKHNS